MVTKGKAKAAFNAAINKRAEAPFVACGLCCGGLLPKLKDDWELAPLATDGQTGGAECEVF